MQRNETAGKGMHMNAAEKYNACVEGLKAFAQQTGAQEVVIGLSGGIDSSLTACMCVDAFGVEAVHGYMLPGPFSTEHSLVDAQELAMNLGLHVERISIAQPYEAFATELARLCPGFTRTSAGENTQARCRMIVLMALSNYHGWMLVNTGNKSEAMMGYSTLYGDTAGAYAPIGGLYKTDVYAVARYVNDHAKEVGNEPPIPENVFVKPPSAELAPGQEDEKALGTTYAELDKLLIDMMEKGMSEAELAAAGYDPAEVQRVSQRVKSYEFKRALEPAFPEIAYV